MLLLATKSCPPLMVDRYRGLKINTGKRKVSWHLTCSSAEIQLTLSRFTRLWFLLETELCLVSGSWENIFISMSYCYSYKAQVFPDFFPIKKRKKMEWKYQSLWEKMEHLYTEKMGLASIPCSYRHKAVVDARPGRLCWILQDNLVSARKDCTEPRI